MKKPGQSRAVQNTCITLSALGDLVIRAWTVNQFNVGHHRIITSAVAALENTQIATGAVLVTRAQFFKELANRFLVAQAIERGAAMRHAVVFCQGDQGLGHATQFLCLGQSGLDELVLDKAIGHVAEHRFTVRSVPVQFTS